MRYWYLLILAVFILFILSTKPSYSFQSTSDSVEYYFQKESEFISAKNLDSVWFFQAKLELAANNENDYKTIISAYRLAGHLLEESGAYEKAISLYRKGVELARSYDDVVRASNMLTDISQAYRIFHNYEKAIEYGKQAYDILETDQTNDLVSKAEALSQIAAGFTEMGKPDSSVRYHLMALEFLPRLDSTHLKSNMINLGYTYMELGELEKCKFWTERGLSLFRPSKIPYALGTIYTNLGMYGNRANKLDYALRMFDSAVYYTNRSKYIETFFWIYEERAEVYRKQKRYDLAISDLENLLVLKDSVFKGQRDVTTQEMEAKYQTEKKEQQIANQLLQLAEQRAVNQRNSIFIVSLILLLVIIVLAASFYRSRLKRKQQIELNEKDLASKAMQLNAVIGSQENERRRFAKDLHDGFGQMISILKMNIESLKGGSNETEQRMNIFNKSKEMLDEMYDELRGICFNLMPETLVKKGLVEALNEFAGRINVAGKVHVEIIEFGLSDRLRDLEEISLYRIVQEWVNNILKYNNAEKITIQLTKDEQEITLTIEDNGIGFDQNLVKQSKGNGWKNIQSRANLIEAEVELETTKGQTGTMLILNIPVLVSDHTIRVTTDQ